MFLITNFGIVKLNLNYHKEQFHPLLCNFIYLNFIICYLIILLNLNIFHFKFLTFLKIKTILFIYHNVTFI